MGQDALKMFKTSNLSLPERLLESHAMPTISGYHGRLMSGNNMHQGTTRVICSSIPEGGGGGGQNEVQGSWDKFFDSPDK